MDCHPNHEEWDQDVDNVKSHQGVFRTRESTAHFHFLCLWKRKKININILKIQYDASGH